MEVERWNNQSRVLADDFLVLRCCSVVEFENVIAVVPCICYLHVPVAYGKLTPVVDAKLKLVSDPYVNSAVP